MRPRRGHDHPGQKRSGVLCGAILDRVAHLQRLVLSQRWRSRKLYRRRRRRPLLRFLGSLFRGFFLLGFLLHARLSFAFQRLFIQLPRLKLTLGTRRLIRTSTACVAALAPALTLPRPRRSGTSLRGWRSPPSPSSSARSPSPPRRRRRPSFSLAALSAPSGFLSWCCLPPATAAPHGSVGSPALGHRRRLDIGIMRQGRYTLLVPARQTRSARTSGALSASSRRRRRRRRVFVGEQHWVDFEAQATAILSVSVSA